MTQKLIMGNQAIALGAIRAGVGVVTGYPGTPSSEILETLAMENPGDIYIEWSVNEKSAMEVAAGASYAGMRTMVTMKQVGLNVASDPIMSLAYIGVEGGMVVVVADDPGPISSQTEQDTRQFGVFSKIPVFDPTSVEEAYYMIEDAFDYSEKYHTPVIFRSTTRICHSNASFQLEDKRVKVNPEGFKKDSKWVIFPKLSYINHQKIEERNPILAEDFSSYRFNEVSGQGKKGIASSGVSYVYTQEALSTLEGSCKLLKVTTPYPFPEKQALEFLEGLDEVLVIEELSPYIEKELIHLCGKYQLPVKIKGKISKDMISAGENSVSAIKEVVGSFLDIPYDKEEMIKVPVELPVRPPVLCAGCPHRASFYAVKMAMKGKKAVFSGDIGCYTLGNAAPLNMVDTCLCMGAGITMAQGLHRAEPDAIHFAFVGDSTFFHTGIPGVINAVYNQTEIVLIVLDNSTTAMTGNQPHPGTGKTMMGDITEKISIHSILSAIGVQHIQRVNPFDLTKGEEAVKKAVNTKGVKAIIFEAPCIQITKPDPSYVIDLEKCTNCEICIKQLGCPAIIMEKGQVVIDANLCYGCSICAQVCPFEAIGEEQ